MSRTDDDWTAVRSCDLFQGVAEPLVRELASSHPPTTLKKGQLLFHQGDPASAFYVVLEGWMKLYRSAPDGAEIIIHVAKAGETFAEAAMFMEGAYPVHAEAATPVRLQRISASTVRDCIVSNPSFAFAMLGAMSFRLRRLVNEIENLKRRGAAELVAGFLLQLCDESAGDPCTVTLPFEKALVAARLGIKPESFSRALVRLKDVGVEAIGPEVTIASRQALGKFLDQVTPSSKD